ncbi:MAG: hypothetical protein J5639_09180 [Bacteroidales bacterium]|nr:hypothetical protein [Bacteroidales bacterium]
MESSRIVNRLAVAAIALTALLTGCKLRTDHAEVVLPAAVRTVMYDTASVNFIDFAHYGELKSLPIGIFDADSTSMTLLETCTGMDCFDNITGVRRSDGILDFAGEYFQYYTARSDDDCFNSTLFLMEDRYWDSFEKERSKIIVAGGALLPAKGLDEMMSLSEHNGAGVKVISAVDAGVRAMFDSLSDNNIASLTVALLSNGSNDRLAYSEAIRKISAEQGNTRSISLISGKNSREGLSQIVEELKDASTKSPLKVIIVDGLGEDYRQDCLALLEQYRSSFGNGTYPYRSILADDIIFVNPSLSAAVECYTALRRGKNLALRADKQKVSYFYGF